MWPAQTGKYPHIGPGLPGLELFRISETPITWDLWVSPVEVFRVSFYKVTQLILRSRQKPVCCFLNLAPKQFPGTFMPSGGLGISAFNSRLEDHPSASKLGVYRSCFFELFPWCLRPRWEESRPCGGGILLRGIIRQNVKCREKFPFFRLSRNLCEGNAHLLPHG